MSSLLQWEEVYCFQKFLPLLTRWQLIHYGSSSQNLPLRGNVWPDFIKKKRAPKGVASYEIVWKDDQKCFDGLIPTSQMETYLSLKGCANEEEALQSLWSTIEPIDLVEKAYPDLVEKFLQSKTKPKKTKAIVRKPAKRTNKIANNSLHDMSSLQQALDEIDVPKAKPRATKKTTKKSPKAKKAKVTLQSLQKFFQPNSKAKTKQSSPLAFEPDDAASALPKPPAKTINLSNFSIDVDDIENEDCDLSQIIGDIVSKPPPITEICGKKLRFDEVNIQRKPSPIQLDEEFEVDTNLDTNKENIAVKEAAEESFDEFDLIVMGKAPKDLPNKYLSVSKEQMKSSTPVLIHRFMRRHSIQSQTKSPDKEPVESAVITTSFFSVAADDDVDLFEQSIDFKNMEDEDVVSSEASDDDPVPSDGVDDM